MRSSKGILYKIHKKMISVKTRLLWNSRCNSFKRVGKNSNVYMLPDIIGEEYIEIGDDFFCGKDVRIEAWDKYQNQTFSPQIIIGNNVTFTDRCHVSCTDRVEIGNGVLLGRDVLITDNSHGDATIDMLDIPPVKRPLTSKGPVIIGDNVWIGKNVTILSGVSIGKGSIIGANSVVNNDILENCVAVGNPVRVIKRIEVEHN